MHHHDASYASPQSAPIPMVIGVEGHSVSRATNHSASLFKALLGRVVTELTQWLPVVLTPEQLPRSLNAKRITAVLRILQSRRDLVVDNDRGNRPHVGRAHTAEWVLTKEYIPRLLPAKSVTTLSTTAPSITAHAGYPGAPRRSQPSLPTNVRTTH